jgi:hypothetical protein
MNLAVARLVLTSVLFIGWLGYLGFQVATRPTTAGNRQLVVSHPQILASRIDVVANVPSEVGEVEVTVERVLYPEENSPVKVGDKITVTNIHQCQAPPQVDDRHPPHDWTGPGSYLLPVRPTADKKYEVAPIPPSPGFPGQNPDGGSWVRLYPATPEALAQYHTIKKPTKQ